jgi:hypothetical protein
VKLANWLIAKSIIEILFLIALVVVAQYRAFHPYFRGDAEFAAGYIAGWAVDEAASASHPRSVELQLYIDGKLVATTVADKPRPDVRAHGRSQDDFCGYSFLVPPLSPGAHEARVYAVHSSDGDARKTLQMINHPVLFQIEK